MIPLKNLHICILAISSFYKVFKSRLSYLTSQSSLSVILRTTSTAIPKHLQINPETLDALEQTTLLQNILSRYASDPLVTALRKAADASTSPSTPPNQPYHTPTNDPTKPTSPRSCTHVHNSSNSHHPTSSVFSIDKTRENHHYNV
ncbi:hypothetical protein BC829DRAFT_66060 [Chytridium lagenaria]|nr:hypothetical protein BC829DRAFT_66060 [Chytridium lagenaria]